MTALLELRDVVKHFPDIPEDQIVGTDSVFFMRQAIQAGYTLNNKKIVSDLKKYDPSSFIPKR
jgi:hypothetical protein